MCTSIKNNRNSARLVGPSPEVLKAIRAELANRSFSAEDRLMPTVATALGLDNVAAVGLNSGIFYPPDQIPAALSMAPPSKAVRQHPTSGNIKCLVLLVDFSDNPGTVKQAQFNAMLFSNKSYPTGSMSDYYNENSYGKAQVSGDVIGWLRMPQTYAFYVNGDSGTGNYPNNAQKLTEDALTVAIANGLDLANYDSDGDGFVDGLFIVHAGGGAEAEPDLNKRKNMIWSHQWNLPTPFQSNGKKVYSYCTEPEDGKVGVFCHEFGHMLGLPDLYDTSYQSEGVGVWCVMGAGSWNDGGTRPAHFCSWSKSKLGWLTPTNLVTGSHPLSLDALSKVDHVYRGWKGGVVGSEYFLLENRQLDGFDNKLPTSGLLIWHIDERQRDNNVPGRYMVAVEQADGNEDLEASINRGDDGDPFPGSTGNKIFNDTSVPSSRDNRGRTTSVSVDEIKEANKKITCKVTLN